MEASNLSDADRKRYDTIAKLMQLASKNPNQEEAAAAAAKAQALLVQYNLDAAFIDQAQGRVDGRREEMKVEGGFYQYQRDLYKAVAELNFCFYFTQTYWEERTKQTRRRMPDGEWRIRPAGSMKRKNRHRVIGRMVNTATTKVMCSYLLDAIERLTRERLQKSNGNVDQTQLLSRWATSYREGMASNLIERIQEQQILDERERKATAAKAKRAAEAQGGAGSTATSLTLADVKKSEKEANYDFMYGEGAWAEVEDYAKKQAAARKVHREKMAKLAKEDPKEFARLEKEANKGRRFSYGRSERERPKDWGAYNAGQEAGKGISLHRQADAPKAAERIGNK